MAEPEPTLVTVDELADFGTAMGERIVQEVSERIVVMNLELALSRVHTLAGIATHRCDVDVDTIIAKIEGTISAGMKLLKRAIEEGKKQEKTRDDAE